MINSSGQMMDRRLGMIQLAAAMAIAGTVGVFVEEAGVSAVDAVFFRCVFGALALALVCWWRGYFRNTGLTPVKLSLVFVGGLCIVLNWVAFFEAIHLTSITLTTIVYHVQPFWVLLLGVAVFKDRITLDRIAWMLAGFLGLVLATGWRPTGIDLPSSQLLGIGLALIASLLYAGTAITGKALVGVRPHLTALIHSVLGIAVLGPFAKLTPDLASTWQWGWLIGLGVIHTGIVYVLMYSAYPKLPTAAIAVLAFVYPAVAIVVDILVYGRVVEFGQIAGMALIGLAGLGVNLGWRLVPRFRSVMAATKP